MENLQVTNSPSAMSIAPVQMPQAHAREITGIIWPKHYFNNAKECAPQLMAMVHFSRKPDNQFLILKCAHIDEGFTICSALQIYNATRPSKYTMSHNSAAGCSSHLETPKCLLISLQHKRVQPGSKHRGVTEGWSLILAFKELRNPHTKISVAE